MSVVIYCLFALVAAHFLCDYGLQGETMAREKSRWSTSELQKFVPWYHWLTAHAFIHGGAVLFILGFWQLALVETAVHWVTDYLKCSKRIGINTDQAIHLISKLVWLAIAYYLW